jgi:hypothetical protein
MSVGAMKDYKLKLRNFHASHTQEVATALARNFCIFSDLFFYLENET